MRWLPSPDDVLAFARNDRFVSVTNLSAAPVALPGGAVVLLTSGDLSEGSLPTDVAAWLRLERPLGEDRHSWLSGGAGME